MAARGFRGVALLMGGIALLAGAQGCVDDGVSLHVICPIQPTIEEDACVFDANGQTCVAQGVMNLFATQTYTLSLRVESGLKPRVRQVPPVSEPNGIQIRGATVELRDSAGALLTFSDGPPNPFEVNASGYIEPEGRGAITLAILSEDYGARLHNGVDRTPLFRQIVAAIKVKGKTSGGLDVEGGEFTWPIRLISKRTCLPLDYCVDMFGQDNFAEACGL